MEEGIAADGWLDLGGLSTSNAAHWAGRDLLTEKWGSVCDCKDLVFGRNPQGVGFWVTR